MFLSSSFPELVVASGTEKSSACDFQVIKDDSGLNLDPSMLQGNKSQGIQSLEKQYKPLRLDKNLYILVIINYIHTYVYSLC